MHRHRVLTRPPARRLRVRVALLLDAITACPKEHTMDEPRSQYFPEEWVAEGYSVGPMEWLDEGHAVERYLHNGRLIGLNEHHRRADGTWCGGYIAFEAFKVFQASGHQLISEDPLHVEASLACRTCPSHGWVRAGRWTEA